MTIGFPFHSFCRAFLIVGLSAGLCVSTAHAKSKSKVHSQPASTSASEVVDLEKEAENHEKMFEEIQTADNKSHHIVEPADKTKPTLSVMQPFLEPETKTEIQATPESPRRTPSSAQANHEKPLPVELPVDTKPALKMPTEVGGFGVLMIPSDSAASKKPAVTPPVASVNRAPASLGKITLRRIASSPKHELRTSAAKKRTPSLAKNLRPKQKSALHQRQSKKHFIVSVKKKKPTQIAAYKKTVSSK